MHNLLYGKKDAKKIDPKDLIEPTLEEPEAQEEEDDDALLSGRLNATPNAPVNPTAAALFGATQSVSTVSNAYINPTPNSHPYKQLHPFEKAIALSSPFVIAFAVFNLLIGLVYVSSISFGHDTAKSLLLHTYVATGIIGFIGLVFVCLAYFPWIIDRCFPKAKQSTRHKFVLLAGICFATCMILGFASGASLKHKISAKERNVRVSSQTLKATQLMDAYVATKQANISKICSKSKQQSFAKEAALIKSEAVKAWKKEGATIPTTLAGLKNQTQSIDNKYVVGLTECKVGL